MKKQSRRLIAILLIILVILSTNLTSLAVIADKEDVKPVEITDESQENIQENIIEDENPRLLNEDTEYKLPDNSNQISTFSARSNSYTGTLIEGRTEGPKTYVQRDGKNYVYTRENGANFITIKRYCFETGVYEEIFSNWNIIDVERTAGYYIQDNVIYTAVYSTRDEEEITIVGYDTQTETVSYNQTFPVNGDIYESVFCMDTNKNVYFLTTGSTEEENVIKSYNKDGEYIDSFTFTYTIDRYRIASLLGTNKENTVLFVCLPKSMGISNWWDDYIIKIDNGKFIDENLYLMRQMGGIDWRFLDESKTHGYSQYGEFYEIDYNADNEAGVEYILKKNVQFDGSYLTLSDLTTSDDTYAYIGEKDNGMIYIVNWHTYQIEKTLSLGEEKMIIGVYKTNSDKILVEYYNRNEGGIYALELSTSDFIESKQNIEITDHTALTHTKAEIKNKYDELAIVNKSQDLYETEPSVTAPYKAGSLQEQVQTDTINQINYFRWVAGLNSIKQNTQYMEQSQKGAVLLASSVFSHFPPKPSDMDQDFYTQARAATGAGIGNSANISAGRLMAYTIQGYVDDTSNVEPNVGHRLSMLDPQAESVSFGYAEGYGVVNVFNSNEISNPDPYYAWPSPGNFPVESMSSSAMWSVQIQDTNLNISGTRYIVIKANGKEYSSLNNDFSLYWDSMSNAYFFSIPSELKSYLTEGENAFKHGKSVEVEVHGLADNAGNTYIIKYPINFFSLDKILTDISLPQSSKIVIGSSRTLNLIRTPSEAIIEGKVEWTSSNPNIISIDSNGTITAKALGESTITAEVDGFKATTTITVIDYILGDVDGDGKINARDAKLIMQHFTSKIQLTEEEQKRAEVSGDGKINARDAKLIMQYFTSKIDKFPVEE